MNLLFPRSAGLAGSFLPPFHFLGGSVSQRVSECVCLISLVLSQSLDFFPLLPRFSLRLIYLKQHLVWDLLHRYSPCYHSRLSLSFFVNLGVLFIYFGIGLGIFFLRILLPISLKRFKTKVSYQFPLKKTLSFEPFVFSRLRESLLEKGTDRRLIK